MAEKDQNKREPMEDIMRNQKQLGILKQTLYWDQARMWIMYAWRQAPRHRGFRIYGLGFRVYRNCEGHGRQ